MDYRDKKYYFIVGGIVFFLWIIFANRFIQSSLKSAGATKRAETKENQPSSKFSEVFIEENSKYHLASDDPEKYNIKFQRQHDAPLTQQQWEYKMRQSLTQSSIGGASPEDPLAGVQKTPKEIAEQITAMGAQIKEYEAMARSRPGDSNVQEKLQTLYMLKATLTVLKDKVTKQK